MLRVHVVQCAGSCAAGVVAEWLRGENWCGCGGLGSGLGTARMPARLPRWTRKALQDSPQTLQDSPTKMDKKGRQHASLSPAAHTGSALPACSREGTCGTALQGGERPRDGEWGLHVPYGWTGWCYKQRARYRGWPAGARQAWLTRLPSSAERAAGPSRLLEVPKVQTPATTPRTVDAGSRAALPPTAPTA